MTIKEFIDFGVEKLAPLYSKEESISLCNRVLVGMLGYKDYAYISDPDRKILLADKESVEIKKDEALSEAVMREAVLRMAKGEPVQYVLGYEMFCGHRFNVGPGVLIPRPETEAMVSLITLSNSSRKPHEILDICTGSGCIAWSLWSNFPRSYVYGCDNSDKALEYARNQKIERREPDVAGGMPEHIDSVIDGAKADQPAPQFFKCDILSPEALSMFGGKKFDIIASNPPYVMEREKKFMRPNVLNYEPAEALFVSDDNPLVFYRRISQVAFDMLNRNGRIYFEINELFGEQVASMMGDMGFSEPQIVTDINNKPRIVRALRW
jgi:release factor glutamine methyltransferase